MLCVANSVKVRCGYFADAQSKECTSATHAVYVCTFIYIYIYNLRGGARFFKWYKNIFSLVEHRTACVR